jgi:epoxyqueuosine reductase
MPISTSELSGLVRGRALLEGFDVVRIANAAAAPLASERLRDFLGRGRHGDMAWMAANAERRADPSVLWPEAKSIIVVGVNYGPDHDPLQDLAVPGAGAISVYARGDDYHDVIKARLNRLGHWLCETYGGDAKVFVDTAPVLEKALAQAAGLGWQGKHTNLVSRDFGSWLFLGSVFSTLELEPDPPETDHCGGCHACLDICPTRAFAAPYQLDARRCISYLTIEHKGHIPREFRAAIGNRIYGCDDCLAVCPWNKFAQVAHEARFAARPQATRPALQKLVRLDDAAFREMFSKSPIKRIGRDRFVRNVLIAIGNTGDAALVVEAVRLADDPSPLVRAMAAWAVSRLLALPAVKALAAIHATNESDADVRREWLP